MLKLALGNTRCRIKPKTSKLEAKNKIISKAFLGEKPASKSKWWKCCLSADSGDFPVRIR